MFKQAPLSFQGQNNKWFKQYSQLLDRMAEIAQHENKPVCVIDVFGGSGLLSHWAKRVKPQFQVIYNDFDNYVDRLAHIHEINSLLSDIIDHFPNITHNTKMTTEQIQVFREIVQKHVNDGEYIDTHALSSWVLFSGAPYQSLEQLLTTERLYFKQPKNLYNEEKTLHYLDGITVIHEDASDYHAFNEKIKHLINPDALRLYVLDPPYLYSDKSGYRNTYFKIHDSIELINYFRHPDRFIFFNSEKSCFCELLHALSAYIPDIDENYEVIRMKNIINKDGRNDEFALFRIS